MMRNIMVRDIDNDTYEWLERRAAREQRTIPGEIRQLLLRARTDEQQLAESTAAFHRIRDRRRKQSPVTIGSTDMLREERQQ